MHAIGKSGEWRKVKKKIKISHLPQPHHYLGTYLTVLISFPLPLSRLLDIPVDNPAEKDRFRKCRCSVHANEGIYLLLIYFTQL